MFSVKYIIKIPVFISAMISEKTGRGSGIFIDVESQEHSDQKHTTILKCIATEKNYCKLFLKTSVMCRFMNQLHTIIEYISIKAATLF